MKNEAESLETLLPAEVVLKAVQEPAAELKSTEADAIEEAEVAEAEEEPEPEAPKVPTFPTTIELTAPELAAFEATLKKLYREWQPMDGRVLDKFLQAFAPAFEAARGAK